MTSQRQVRRVWLDWEIQLLTENYSDIRTDAIAAVLDRDLQNVYAKATRLGLAKSAEYLASPDACRLRREGEVGKAFRFQKGIVPANKGLRRPGFSKDHGRMAETTFKPGQRSQNWQPQGSVRKNPDGYLEVKVAEAAREGGRIVFHSWVLAHRLVWMLAHGVIPDGHVIVFKRDRQRPATVPEISVDDLECISQRELALRNSIHNLPPELKQVAQLRGELTRAIHKREKETS